MFSKDMGMAYDTRYLYYVDDREDVFCGIIFPPCFNAVGWGQREGCFL